ncbi:MAG: triose-phosphate isomerase, partial [Deinococcota bacterium]
MTQTPSDSRAFVTALAKQLSDLSGILASDVQTFVIPPSTSLAGLAHHCQKANIWLGAQTMHDALTGAFTGEISAPMLRDLDVDMVMLGHAERRQLFGETDAALQRKVDTALAQHLKVLLCVGETAEERAYGITREVVSRQLRVALHNVNHEMLTHTNLLIAYEPVWAIGEAGSEASPQDIAESVSIIRETLNEMFPECSLPLLYGG